jgi:hypothetical protein
MKPETFIDYWNAVDAAMQKHFGLDTGSAGIRAEVIADVEGRIDCPDRTHCEEAQQKADWERPRNIQLLRLGHETRTLILGEVHIQILGFFAIVNLTVFLDVAEHKDL